MAKSAGSIVPSAVSRGNNLQQASFAAKRAARLAARPGPLPASSSSRALNQRESPSGGVSASNRSTRAISTVSKPQRAAGAAGSVIADQLNHGTHNSAMAAAAQQVPAKGAAFIRQEIKSGGGFSFLRRPFYFV